MREELSLVGLAFRAGKLAAGDAAVNEAVTAKRVRLICTAKDASERILERAKRMPERCNGLYTETLFTRAEIGASLGLTDCGIIAFLDPGFAWGFSKKLIEIDSERYRALEAELRTRQDRAARRRVKKYRDPGGAKKGKQ